MALVIAAYLTITAGTVLWLYRTHTRPAYYLAAMLMWMAVLILVIALGGPL